MSASMTMFIQVSCLLMQDAVSQYPMYGVPQIISYQSPQFYNTEIQSKHRHKHKKREKKKTHRSHKEEDIDNESSSAHAECASESEDCSSDECSCDLTCDQCSSENRNCCDLFCNSCMSQGYMLYPLSYPVIMAQPHPVLVENLQPPNHSNGNDAKNKEENNNNGPKTTKMPVQNTSSTKIPTTPNVQSSTENYRRKLSKNHFPHKKIEAIVDKPNENEIESNMQDYRRNFNSPQNYFNDIIFKVPHKGKTKYILTSLRRVKENWTPKQGGVPIPENVATVLLTNLRKLKSIQTIEEPKAIPDPMKVVQASDNSRYGTSDGDAITYKTNSETLYVRDTGSGMTIEGPLSAIQSLNRRLLAAMQMQNTENEDQDALPMELIKKLYQY